MPRRVFIAAAGVMLMLAGGGEVRAWNGTGHEVAALIAWQDLTPAVRENVARLLRAHPDYADLLTHAATPAEEKDREAFLDAATWPDLVRTPGTKSSKYNHPTWHYIDFPYDPGGARAFKPLDLTWQAGKDPSNAVQAWEKNLADLRDAQLGNAERAIALCWIEHLAADIHQPLHCASLFNDRFPNGDEGGNLILVRTGGAVRNLHAVWDDLLGGDQSYEGVEKIRLKIVEAHPRKEFAGQLKVTDFASWARAGSEQATVDAYLEGTLDYLTRDEHAKEATREVPVLPAGYLERARTAAERDLALAGYRLADCLNGLLGQ